MSPCFRKAALNKYKNKCRKSRGEKEIISQKVKRAVEKVEKLGRELESAKQQNEPEDQCRRLVKDVLFLCLTFTTYILLPYSRSMSVQVQTDPTCTIRGEGRGSQSVWPSRAMSAL